MEKFRGITSYDIIIASGMLISAFAACCIDSPGIYGCAAAIVCVAGGIIAGAGYIAGEQGARRRNRREAGFYEARGKDRLDAGLEIINL